jgi:hypothetical protein
VCQSLVGVRDPVFNTSAWSLKFKILSVLHWEVNFEKDQLSNTNISDKLYRPFWDHINSSVAVVVGKWVH